MTTEVLNFIFFVFFRHGFHHDVLHTKNTRHTKKRNLADSTLVEL